MSDLSLNSNLSVHLDDRNDLAQVTGRDAFEQSVSVALTDMMQENTLGLNQSDTIEEKIRLQITRVAREHDSIEGVPGFEVSQKENHPDTYQVTVKYASGDITNLSTEVTAN